MLINVKRNECYGHCTALILSAGRVEDGEDRRGVAGLEGGGIVYYGCGGKNRKQGITGLLCEQYNFPRLKMLHGHLFIRVGLRDHNLKRRILRKIFRLADRNGNAGDPPHAVGDVVAVVIKVCHKSQATGAMQDHTEQNDQANSTFHDRRKLRHKRIMRKGSRDL